MFFFLAKASFIYTIYFILVLFNNISFLPHRIVFGSITIFVVVNNKKVSKTAILQKISIKHLSKLANQKKTSVF